MDTLLNRLVIAPVLTSFWRRHYTYGLSPMVLLVKVVTSVVVIREMAIELAQHPRFGAQYPCERVYNMDETT